MIQIIFKSSLRLQFIISNNKYKLLPVCITYLTGPYIMFPAFGSQIYFENLALRARQKKAVQNEAGKIKGRPKFGQLKYFA